MTKFGGLSSEATLDCVVVGGGAAGLSAATYLARFRRSLRVIDAGESRLFQIPRARNVPGFPEGITGADLHDRLSQQAAKYGMEAERGWVSRVETSGDGFIVRYQDRSLHTRTILLATGVQLDEPPINDVADAISRAIVRYCPICDGFEAQNKRIAVLGGTAKSFQEARFLRNYSDQIVFVPATNAATLDERDIALAAQEGIGVAPSAAATLHYDGHGIDVILENGASLRFDILYPCLGVHVQTALVATLGAKFAGDGAILADAHQRTNVAGLYVAGDVVKGLDQIASAFGHAAIAATAIHNDLRERVLTRVESET